MDYTIRTIQMDEYGLLENFLYEAIFIPEGTEPPSRSILMVPELQVYIHKFGEYIDDHALAAEVDGEVIGAIWVRIMNDYGHINDDTPSLAMSLLKPFRGMGIGSALLNEMLILLKDQGYRSVSLSVQKDNYAVKLYERAGFSIFNDRDDEYMMIHNLEETGHE